MAIVYYYVRDFFLFIGNTVTFVFDLISSLIDVLVAGGEWLTSVIGSLPAFLIVPLTALVIISVLYKILGREGQD